MYCIIAIYNIVCPPFGVWKPLTVTLNPTTNLAEVYNLKPLCINLFIRYCMQDHNSNIEQIHEVL